MAPILCRATVHRHPCETRTAGTSAWFSDMRQRRVTRTLGQPRCCARFLFAACSLLPCCLPRFSGVQHSRQPWQTQAGSSARRMAAAVCAGSDAAAAHARADRPRPFPVQLHQPRPLCPCSNVDCTWPGLARQRPLQLSAQPQADEPVLRTRLFRASAGEVPAGAGGTPEGAPGLGQAAAAGAAPVSETGSACSRAFSTRDMCAASQWVAHSCLARCDQAELVCVCWPCNICILRVRLLLC